jgi:catechol 2,3-dioxygenase-like lactoylglutathione lyase family enzyme
LVFVQVAERFKKPVFHRCRVGLNHLAFHAECADQVDEIAEQLRERGVTLLYPDRPRKTTDGYTIFFEDPDRIKVELIAPATPPNQAPKA